jgi:transposase InsO family protein
MRKTPKSPGEKIVKDIKRATRKHYSSEEKIRIVLDGPRGEDSRECLAIRVDRKLNSGNVIDALNDLFILRGVPSFIRSDNGPEFIAQALRGWIKAVGAKTAYIEPGSPWENGYCESVNARFRDELLNGEIFYSLREAQILIEEWRKHYNTKRPHSALGYRPPAPEAIVQMDQRPIMH